MKILSKSWESILEFQPELILVSAGFDAYSKDPLTQMRLGIEDFKTLGAWIRKTRTPVAATLEGGTAKIYPCLSTHSKGGVGLRSSKILVWKTNYSNTLTLEGLNALCDSLEAQHEIALDSEADNLHL